MGTRVGWPGEWKPLSVIIAVQCVVTVTMRKVDFFATKFHSEVHSAVNESGASPRPRVKFIMLRRSISLISSRSVGLAGRQQLARAPSVALRRSLSDSKASGSSSVEKADGGDDKVAEAPLVNSKGEVCGARCEHVFRCNSPEFLCTLRTADC